MFWGESDNLGHCRGGRIEALFNIFCERTDRVTPRWCRDKRNRDGESFDCCLVTLSVNVVKFRVHILHLLHFRCEGMPKKTLSVELGIGSFLYLPFWPCFYHSLGLSCQSGTDLLTDLQLIFGT